MQTHGHGDVDEETLELAVAVGEAKHGVGLGARLMSALAEAASRGRLRPSQPERRRREPALLYERIGYREISSD